MERTNFGKYVATLRIKHNQTQADMAKILSVSAAFLSKAESGRAKPVLKWVDILSKNYALSLEETEELREIINMERTNKKEYIKNLTVADQELVFLLINNISHMSPTQKEKIKKLISE